MIRIDITPALLAARARRRRNRSSAAAGAPDDFEKLDKVLVIQANAAFHPKTPAMSPTASPSLPPRPQTRKTAPTTPHPHVDRVGLSPLTTLDTFVVEHMHAQWVRYDYLHPGYKNRPALGRATRATFDQREAFFLHANNMWSRVRYAKIFGERLERFAAQREAGEPMFLVTLVNRDHTVPRKVAADFNIACVTGWAHQVLRGASYVGMVEAAYFSNLRLRDPHEYRYVSWHSHVLLWGVTEAEMIALRDAINRCYITAVEGVPAAHYRVLQLEEVFGRCIYICKAPLDEYRVWARKKERVNAETGEIFEYFSGRFKVKSRRMRPCDAVHMSSVFIDRYIDQLAFAAGEGRQILREINADALAEFNRWEARQGYMKARLK